MKTIAEWQRAAYELAVAKGFHDCRACNGHRELPAPPPVDSVVCPACNGSGRCDPTKRTRIASCLALIHCEISEAVECVARGFMHLHWLAPDGTRTGKVENLTVEQARSWTNYLRGQNYKPEGFPVELADVFLRTCDLAESLKVELKYDFDKRHTFTPLTDPEAIAAALRGVHKCLDSFDLEPYFGFQLARSGLTSTLHALHQVAHATGVDLLAMAELKHAYNQTRPIRHGGKLL